MLSSIAQALWQDVLAEVEREVGAGAVDLWLRRAALVEADREEVVVVVATRFERDRLAEAKIAEPLARAFATLLGGRPRMRIDVDPRAFDAAGGQAGAAPPPVAQVPPPPVPPAAAARAAPRVAAAASDDQSFRTFVTGPSNKLAFDAADKVCCAPGAELNPLVLCGPDGIGKTHLLTAISRRLRDEAPRRNVVLATAEDFTNQFTSGIRNHRTASFRDRYRLADALLIDDLHMLCSKPKTQIEFIHTFEALLHGQRQIVVTTEESPKNLASLHPGLAGRLLAGLVVTIEAPELDTRRRILEARARRMKLSLGMDVLEFIARNVTRNVRDLCGALAIVQAHAAIGDRVDLDLARRALKDLLGPEPALPPEALLLEIVAEDQAVDAAAVRAGGRRAEIARARQIAMYLTRRLTTLSLKEIGAFFGRGPSTVTFAAARVECLVEVDPAVRRAVADCTRRFAEQTRGR